MSTLHTVHGSAFAQDAFRSCLRFAQHDDGILLMEDAVYAALRGTEAAMMVEEVARRLTLYALQPDVAARGVLESRLVPGVRVIDYRGFVRLAVQYARVQAWS